MFDDFNIGEEIRKYTKHWKWFAFFALIGFICAHLFIRYSTPEYLVQAKIQIVQEQSDTPGGNLLQELSLFPQTENNLEDEMEIITSRSNLIEVTKKLDLNTTVSSIGNFKNTELYQNSPVKLNIIAADSIINKADFQFFLSLDSTTNFGFSLEEEEDVVTYAFGKNIPSPIGDIVITPNEEILQGYLGRKVKVKIDPVAKVAMNYKDAIKIVRSAEFSNILNISLEQSNRDKAQDVINTLIDIYNQNAIDDKQEIADRTSTFIENRIASISSSLSNVDQSAERFKTDRGITDISSEANINVNVGVANRQELANAQTQLSIASSMKDLVDQQKGYEVLPANLGLSDGTIANTTQQYNQLVQERNRLLKSSNEKNPVIVNLDQQLNGLKRTMQASLNSTVNNLGLQVNTLSGQQAVIRSKIYSAPKYETALNEITRRQQTTESLYLYLLQKREESQITVASAAPKSKVIDRAYFGDIPISPRKKIIYLAFVLLGCVIPFSYLYVTNLLDTKVHNMHSIEKMVKDVPILGELPRLARKDKKVIAKNDRSIMAEALRIIRANLDYLINSKSGEGPKNVTFITSGLPGEGKTLFSVNLAMILASTHKKVLLVGADIRNPKFKSFFSKKNIDELKIDQTKDDLGLTEFLYTKKIPYTDIINTLEVNGTGLDVIYSGRIPPNPSELLASKKLKNLFEEVSMKYDYVLVDTAPMMVVSDTQLISNYADNLIYVVRADKTESNSIEFPLKLKNEGKIDGLSFIVNDVKVTDLGYGGKYGYGYGQTAKKWWKFG